jgi:hypothetical protein
MGDWISDQINQIQKSLKNPQKHNFIEYPELNEDLKFNNLEKLDFQSTFSFEYSAKLNFLVFD